MNLPLRPVPAPQPAQQPPAERMPSPYRPYEPAERAPPAPAAHMVGLFCDPEHRHEMIAQAAYFRARHRGFVPGHELEDWLAAEAEVDTALTFGPGR